MKNLVKAILRNRPAVNTIMLAIVIVGAVSFTSIRRELFPEITLDFITVSVPYPGASPEEVEEGICQKIEEYVQSIDGIKKMTSTASEGLGMVQLELETNVKDPQKVLNEVRSEVDRIPSFPQLAENKQVTLATIRSAAILLAVLGPDDEATDPEYHLKLRDLTEKIRTQLLKLKTVKNVTIEGGRDFQIDIEISEATLRKYNLSLDQVATLIGRQNIDTPGGLMRTRSQEVLIRGKDKRLTGEEIAKLPLVTSPEGVVLTIGDLATIHDEFNDSTAINRVNGRNSLMISVNKTTEEDLIRITDEVKKYMAEELPKIVPEGYDVIPFTDMSVFVNDRIELLLTNGWQGMAVAFFFLAVFLNLKLAFWVALGVPIAILATGAYLYGYGESLNMMSLFAFILVLGILVDDSIVIGESVYYHRQQGESMYDAVVNGVAEVAVSVVASVATTIIAFVPLLFIPGMMGKFCHALPIVVISALLASLFECLVILPVHLNHESKTRPPLKKRVREMSWIAKICFGFPMLLTYWTYQFFAYPVRVFYGWTGVVNRWANGWVDWVAHHLYRPLAMFGQRNPMTILALFVGMLIAMVGAMAGGIVPFTAMAKMDSISIYAEISYPDGSTAERTETAVACLQKAVEELDDEYFAKTGKRIIKTIQEAIGVAGSSGGPRSSGMTGSNSGKLMVELIDSDERDVSSSEIVTQWREKAKKYAAYFAGNRTLIFSDSGMGPAGNMIDFKLIGPAEDMGVMKEAAECIKKQLTTYEGVFDVTDDAIPGKSEFRIRVKDSARALGITNAEIANTLRAAYYGAEVMRLQRGRHEVKLMVRYPEAERNEFSSFEDIRFRKNGLEYPMSELADVDIQQGYSTIHRFGQERSITIGADVDTSNRGANPTRIVSDLRYQFVPKLLQNDPKFQNISVLWEGQAETTQESIDAITKGGIVAMLAIFILLSIEFHSYIQPLIILIIIPFSFIGAVLGHFVMGLDVTLMSLFGMVALAGVVINDSIVLIDCFNRLIEEEGMTVYEAVLTGGERRLRPIFLTSITTIGGVGPLCLETSFQAQMMVPMAVSLAFGLIASTLVVLLLVPTFYLLYHHWTDAEMGSHL